MNPPVPAVGSVSVTFADAEPLLASSVERAMVGFAVTLLIDTQPVMSVSTDGFVEKFVEVTTVPAASSALGYGARLNGTSCTTSGTWPGGMTISFVCPNSHGVPAASVNSTM